VVTDGVGSGIVNAVDGIQSPTDAKTIPRFTGTMIQESVDAGR